MDAAAIVQWILNYSQRHLKKGAPHRLTILRSAFLD